MMSTYKRMELIADIESLAAASEGYAA